MFLENWPCKAYVTNHLIWLIFYWHFPYIYICVCVFQFDTFEVESALCSNNITSHCVIQKTLNYVSDCEACITDALVFRALNADSGIYITRHWSFFPKWQTLQQFVVIYSELCRWYRSKVYLLYFVGMLPGCGNVLMMVLVNVYCCSNQVHS